jgi:hypothetical protein
MQLEVVARAQPPLQPGVGMNKALAGGPRWCVGALLIARWAAPGRPLRRARLVSDIVPGALVEHGGREVVAQRVGLAAVGPVGTQLLARLPSAPPPNFRLVGLALEVLRITTLMMPAMARVLCSATGARMISMRSI